MACTALPTCHNCERCSQLFTVVHGRSQLFTVVHSCSRLLAVVHSCSRLFTPDTGPHSCVRCSRMCRAHKCESCAQLLISCAQLCTVAHSCPRLSTAETGPQSRDAMKHAPHHTTCEHCAGSAVQLRQVQPIRALVTWRRWPGAPCCQHCHGDGAHHLARQSRSGGLSLTAVT